MEAREEILIQQFAINDEELKLAYEQHRELKRKLEAYRSRPYLSAAEELEEKRIRKLKLALKDRVMALLARHRNQ